MPQVWTHGGPRGILYNTAAGSMRCEGYGGGKGGYGGYGTTPKRAVVGLPGYRGAKYMSHVVFVLVGSS